MKINIIAALLLFGSFALSAQEKLNPDNEKLKVKGRVIDEQTIKLRWAPTNTRTWLDGKKYGYLIERYTLIVDSIYQEKPVKSLSGLEIKAAPLKQWETQALQSDYAAVIAQAFYGNEFELTASSGKVGNIMNQANELEHRFATSVFMAEYDYKAAELAGWAYTDNNTQKNEQYLYRVILNRPRKQAGDTAVVFIGYTDKRELPPPLNLNAVWGNKAVMLSWNYELLADIYHSYHIERKSSKEDKFKQITQLPVTAIGENMKSVFFTDSLPDNGTEYTYRIWGVTTFNEKSPFSEEVNGKGKDLVSCIPNIFNGHFVESDKARILWTFDCSTMEQISHLSIKRASDPDGVYEILADKISPQMKDITVKINENTNYLKVFAITKDSAETSSLPFLISREDSIPPAIPVGLKVEIDSMAVAHLSWNANTEPDLMGYRILRSFNSTEEKSSVASGPVIQNNFTDTLSLILGNEKVYYSITALDTHYNESKPCLHVAADKPNLKTPALPAMTGYEVSGNGDVTLTWTTNKSLTDVRYQVNRMQVAKDTTVILLETDEKTDTYIDKVEESGDYVYWVVATDRKGKHSESPQRLTLSVTANRNAKAISGFNSYVNRNDRYVELSWKKHPQASLYRIYKQAGDKPEFLWKELDITQNRAVDELVSPNTIYRYTILFVNKDGRTSPANTIKVDY